MRNSSRTLSRQLWGIIAFSLLVHVVSLALGQTWLAEWRCSHLPIHSAVEATGSLIALMVAWLLITLDRQGQGTSFNIWIAGALIGMGVLDGLHALVHVGNSFVWLHSTATFFGGALFVMVWLPRSWSQRVASSWHWAVLGGVLSLGVLSIVFAETLPPMTQNGEFTLWAESLNIIGGVLLFVAAIRLIQIYRQTKNIDDMLFCMHCVLFGAAAIMFEQSALWDVAWWGWHLLRVMAYGVALWFVILSVQRARLDQQEIVLEARMAESANQAKSDFLANMSHEIRTPMTAILGFTDVLLDNITKPEDLEAAKTVKENGEYLLELINDILDLSKIEAGKLEIEKCACSPCSVVADVASLMRVRATQKNVSLEVRFDGPIPETIQSDPTRLRQILINLVGNAIKFTEAGAVKIVTHLSIVTHLLDEPGEGSKLQFDVIDSGIGIASDKIDKLFQPFTQADSSTTREFGGTGLGLAISKRLSEALGGAISVSSAPGKGSTFSFTIATGSLKDVQLLTNANEAVRERKTLGTTESAVSRKLNCRVLLAEDTQFNQRLLSLILKKAGAEVVLADNGQIAFDLAIAANAKEEPFDVILMDMQMPVLDGYAATRKLRDAGYAGPILALTAHAMSSDRQKCMDAGCDDYATKPVDSQTLVETVGRLYDASLQGQAAVKR